MTNAEIRLVPRRDDAELPEGELALIRWTRTLTPAEHESVFATVAVAAEHGLDRMVELYMLVLASIHARKGGA